MAEETENICAHCICKQYPATGMKFVLRFNCKWNALRKGGRAQQQQKLLRRRQHRQQQPAVKSKNVDANEAADADAGGVVCIAGVAACGRKAQLIRHTCAEFVAQMELLHAQLDKQPKFLAKSTKQHFIYNGSFHEAVGRVLLIAEFFAVMPVRGVTAPHPNQLCFAWSNVRTLYTLVFIVLAVIDLVLIMFKVLQQPVTFSNSEPIIFRLSIVVMSLSALSLARQWPSVMMYWYEIESDLPAYTTQLDKGRLAHQIGMVTFVAMMLSLGEHLMNIISVIHTTNTCPIDKDPIKSFFLLTDDHIFHVMPYSSWLALLCKLENVIATFMWNYMDVFVMIVGIGLASKFRQLNDNLLKFKGMQMPVCFWAERRIQYRNLCTLCDRIDNAISLITMISFSNNLYFICVQLLRSLNHMASFAHAAYFYYSLFFLLGRTLAVSLYSASVHDESRKPLRILRCVPKESWCAEVKRFSEEISSDLVALSGMKFFHLTRKLVLSVAGTIVTYELVLIQFHQDNNLWDCVNKQHAPLTAINTTNTNNTINTQ